VNADTAVPADLGPDGRSLWSAVVDDYEPTAADLVVLEMACRTADTVATLEAALAGESLMVRGSMGQPVVHPLLVELRHQRTALQRLVAALALEPVSDDELARRRNERSHAGRALVSHRWSRGA
jgi:phage terminase small subunit